MAMTGKQSGAVLLTSLVLLGLVTIVGAYVFSSGALQERMATSNQLVTLSQNAAQSAVDAFSSEGMYAASGSLNHSANINTNIARKTIDKTSHIPVPFKPQNSNAIVLCVDQNGVIAKSGPMGTDCTGVDFQNTTGSSAEIKGLAEAYYAGCAPIHCGPKMASSLGSDSTLGCPIFYLSGSGWLDVDSDGLPAASGDESRTFIHEWARWQRPTQCSTF